MTAARHPKTEPYHVEVSLSVEPSGSMRGMARTKFMGMDKPVEGRPRTAAPGLQWTAPLESDLGASAVASLANFAARCEARGAVLGFEMPEDKSPLQPFSYLSVNERSWGGRSRARDEDRDSHDWTVWLDEAGRPRVAFRHGKFGMRVQGFASLGSALACLRDLVDGRAWEDFGDQESRRTLLGKGQFFWDTPLDAEPVPVDNFVFEGGGHSWRVAGSGRQSILSWHAPGGRSAHVWNDDHAAGLEGLAAILSGDAGPLAFHGEEFDEPEFCVGLGEPELTAERKAKHSAEFEAGRWIPESIPPLPRALKGVVRVESIFKSEDSFPVDSLLFLTKQGHRVQLSMDAESWTVAATDLDGEKVEFHFSPDGAPGAFRALARALRGEAWQDPDLGIAMACELGPPPGGQAPGGARS